MYESRVSDIFIVQSVSLFQLRILHVVTALLDGCDKIIQNQDKSDIEYAGKSTKLKMNCIYIVNTFNATDMKSFGFLC